MKKISQSIITKRVLWTLFFLFIYCLGNQLVLPFVDLKNANIFGGTIDVYKRQFETLMSPEFYKEEPCQKAWFAFDIQLSSRKELEGINEMCIRDR